MTFTDVTTLMQPTEADMETLGALVGKCLLEGVVLPVELSAAVLCFVLDERQLTAEQLMGMGLAFCSLLYFFYSFIQTFFSPCRLYQFLHTH